MQDDVCVQRCCDLDTKKHYSDLDHYGMIQFACLRVVCASSLMKRQVGTVLLEFLSGAFGLSVSTDSR